MNDANYLQDAWPSLDQAEKRKIVECITNKIVIAKNEVEIDLCYLPSSKHMSKRDRSLLGSNPVLNKALRSKELPRSVQPCSALFLSSSEFRHNSSSSDPAAGAKAPAIRDPSNFTSQQ